MVRAVGHQLLGPSVCIWLLGNEVKSVWGGQRVGLVVEKLVSVGVGKWAEAVGGSERNGLTSLTFLLLRGCFVALLPSALSSFTEFAPSFNYCRSSLASDLQRCIDKTAPKSPS